MAISSSAQLKSRNEIIVKLHVQGNQPSDLFPLKSVRQAMKNMYATPALVRIIYLYHFHRRFLIRVR